MITWKTAALLLSFAALALPRLPARPRHGRLPRPPVYKGAIVVDAGTGAVLFADHADEMSPPASMVKLMTFAVAQDRIRSGVLSLGTLVRVTPADARVGQLGDSTHVGLRVGESFTIDELFYAMMIQSANDAAYAVALRTAGSIPAFVELMNRKARELGMTRTVYRTPNGLPVPSHRIADGDLSTPRDYAILARYLIRHTNILKYTSVRSRLFGVGVRFPPTPMHNHNNLLGRVAGVDGLKTGYTRGAGFCLTATAERQGRRIIVVVMDSPDPRDRDIKAAQLLDLGFATHPFRASIAPVSAAVPVVPVPLAPAASAYAPAAAASVEPAIHFSVP
ncbi:MAG: D-alanyl-D-alanine carboxypeptidase family protein [Opitutaceae bacterium]